MSFKKLPKEKQQGLILVILITLLLVAGLYFGLIQRQNDSLARLADKKTRAAQKLQTVLDAIKRADATKAQLEDAHKELTVAEADVATGDLYAWVINNLRQFKASYNVEIPQYSQLSPVADVNLLPRFPYRQATLTVAGTAHYHDLGRFLADFENKFPHVRLVNLSLDSSGSQNAPEPEMLSFKMDIVTLVKANPS